MHPSPTLTVLCLALAATGGCGSERLQTAVRPATLGDDGGAAGDGDGDEGDRRRGDATVDPDWSATGERDAGPPAIDVRVLFDDEDFPETFIYGETTSVRFEPGDQPFGLAWRTQMDVPPEVPWDAQLVIPLLHPIAEGELLEASFWVRCAQAPPGGPCRTEFAWELSRDPWTRSVETPIDVTDAWVMHTVPFRSVADYQPGESGGLFRVGYPDQVLEIGGIFIRSFGTD